MTPKEKADDLVNKFKLYASDMNRYGLSSGATLIKNAKAAAALCIKEIIDAYENCSAKDSVHFYQQVLTAINEQ